MYTDATPLKSVTGVCDPRSEWCVKGGFAMRQVVTCQNADASRQFRADSRIRRRPQKRGIRNSHSTLIALHAYRCTRAYIVVQYRDCTRTGAFAPSTADRSFIINVSLTQDYGNVRSTDSICVIIIILACDPGYNCMMHFSAEFRGLLLSRANTQFVARILSVGEVLRKKGKSIT